ncbi:acyl-CoA dehydrogenase, short-chain specific, partial [mine drainage metagenome]
MVNEEKLALENDVLSYVREFAEKEIRPIARKIDEEANVPEELIKKMIDMGLFSSYIPEEYGGNSLSFSFLVRVIEEISKACPSTALVLDGALTLFAEPLLMFGSEHMKKKYLSRVAKGSVGGLAITEPGAGSDAASIKTRAVRKGPNYIVNGSKIFVSNGRIAEFFVFDAVTDPSKAHRGITAFVAESSFPGIRISRDIHKMGIRGSSTVEMVFEDAVIPVENVIGSEDDGFRVVMETLDAGRIGIAAQAVG